jgi:chemotaxis protein methyltransferase CheR
MTQFRRHNLMAPLREKPFDLIALKNVVIYFDAASKRVALDHVDQALCAGGYLLTGAAEGVSDLLPRYARLQAWLHQKEPIR